MSNVKFSDFIYAPASNDDFLVGYNSAGTSELRTKVGDVIQLAANGILPTLSAINVNTQMLSSNGVDTFLKVKLNNGTMYGVKLVQI